MLCLRWQKQDTSVCLAVASHWLILVLSSAAEAHKVLVKANSALPKNMLDMQILGSCLERPGTSRHMQKLKYIAIRSPAH